MSAYHSHAPDRPDKPPVCPLCENTKNKILYWHHWDDNQPMKGMWLCPHCNAIVELEDRKLVQKYIGLKAAVIVDFLSR